MKQLTRLPYFLAGFLAVNLAFSVNTAWSQALRPVDPESDSDLRRSVERAAAARRALENARNRLKSELSNLQKANALQGVGDVELEIQKLEKLRNDLRNELGDLRDSDPEIKATPPDTPETVELPGQPPLDPDVVPEEDLSPIIVKGTLDEPKRKKGLFGGIFGNKKERPTKDADIVGTELPDVPVPLPDFKPGQGIDAEQFKEVVERAAIRIRRQMAAEMAQWRRDDAEARLAFEEKVAGDLDTIRGTVEKQTKETENALVREIKDLRRTDILEKEQMRDALKQGLTVVAQGQQNRGKDMDLLRKEIVEEISKSMKENADAELARALKDSQEILVKDLQESWTRDFDALKNETLDKNLADEAVKIFQTKNREQDALLVKGLREMLDREIGQLKNGSMSRKEVDGLINGLAADQAKILQAVNASIKQLEQTRDIAHLRKELQSNIDDAIKSSKGPDMEKITAAVEEGFSKTVKKSMAAQAKEIAEIRTNLKSLSGSVVSDLSTRIEKLEKAPVGAESKKLAKSLEGQSEELAALRKSVEIIKEDWKKDLKGQIEKISSGGTEKQLSALKKEITEELNKSLNEAVAKREKDLVKVEAEMAAIKKEAVTEALDKLAARQQQQAAGLRKEFKKGLEEQNKVVAEIAKKASMVDALTPADVDTLKKAVSEALGQDLAAQGERVNAIQASLQETNDKVINQVVNRLVKLENASEAQANELRKSLTADVAKKVEADLAKVNESLEQVRKSVGSMQADAGDLDARIAKALAARDEEALAAMKKDLSEDLADQKELVAKVEGQLTEMHDTLLEEMTDKIKKSGKTKVELKTADVKKEVMKDVEAQVASSLEEQRKAVDDLNRNMNALKENVLAGINESITSLQNSVDPKAIENLVKQLRIDLTETWQRDLSDQKNSMIDMKRDVDGLKKDLAKKISEEIGAHPPVKAFVEKEITELKADIIKTISEDLAKAPENKQLQDAKAYKDSLLKEINGLEKSIESELMTELTQLEKDVATQRRTQLALANRLQAQQAANQKSIDQTNAANEEAIDKLRADVAKEIVGLRKKDGGSKSAGTTRKDFEKFRGSVLAELEALRKSSGNNLSKSDFKSMEKELLLAIGNWEADMETKLAKVSEGNIATIKKEVMSAVKPAVAAQANQEFSALRKDLQVLREAMQSMEKSLQRSKDTDSDSDGDLSEDDSAAVEPAEKPAKRSDGLFGLFGRKAKAKNEPAEAN